MSTFNAQTLLTHFERIHTGGVIEDVVLDEELGTTAMPDHQEVAVQAPPLADNPSPEPIGVTDLGLLIDAIGAGGEEVELGIRDSARLVVRHGPEHSYEIVLAEPQYIASAVPENFPEMVDSEFEEKPGYPISEEEGAQLETALSVISPDTVTFRFSSNGSDVLVGSETGHSSTVPLSEVTAGDYELLIDAGRLKTVLGLFNTYAKVSIVPTGPGEALGVTYGSYRYLLNPREQ